MNDEVALLAAVLEDPDDVGARIVYGDALVARGVPRGELIQIQCALEANPDHPERPALRRRELELLAAERAWPDRFAPEGVRTTYRRGMVEALHGSTAAVAQAMVASAVREPINELSIDAPTKIAIRRLASRPAFARVGAVELRSGELRSHLVHELFPYDRPRRVRELRLSDTKLTASVVDSLAATPVFRQLERVTLVDHLSAVHPSLISRLTDDAAPPLVSLRLKASLSVDRPLVRELRLPQLRELALVDVGMREDDAVALIAGRPLRALALSDQELFGSDRLVEALAAIPTLESLDLTGCYRAQLAVLAMPSLAWPSLRRLSLARTRCEDLHVQRLAVLQAPLVDLDLSSCHLTERAAKALAMAPFRPTLRRLVLTHTTIGREALEVIASTPWPALEDLALPRLHDTAARTLSRADMPNLVTLHAPGSLAHFGALGIQLGPGLYV